MKSHETDEADEADDETVEETEGLPPRVADGLDEQTVRADPEDTEPVVVMEARPRGSSLDEPTARAETWTPDPPTEERKLDGTMPLPGGPLRRRPDPVEDLDEDSEVSTPTLDTTAIRVPPEALLVQASRLRWTWWMLGVGGGVAWLGLAGALGWWAADRELRAPEPVAGQARP